MDANRGEGMRCIVDVMNYANRPGYIRIFGDRYKCLHCPDVSEEKVPAVFLAGS
jgi:hypothetical protein